MGGSSLALTDDENDIITQDSQQIVRFTQTACTTLVLRNDAAKVFIAAKAGSFFLSEASGEDKERTWSLSSGGITCGTNVEANIQRGPEAVPTASGP